MKKYRGNFLGTLDTCNWVDAASFPVAISCYSACHHSLLASHFSDEVGSALYRCLRRLRANGCYELLHFILFAKPGK